MTMEDAHRAAAAALGEISLAIVRQKAGKQQILTWARAFRTLSDALFEKAGVAFNEPAA